jgi:hypothetical protein
MVLEDPTGTEVTVDRPDDRVVELGSKKYLASSGVEGHTPVIVSARIGGIVLLAIVALLMGLLLFGGPGKSPCLRWANTSGGSPYCAQYEDRP